MIFKNKLVLTALVVCGMSCGASSAFADCSSAAQDVLGDCIDAATISCRQSSPTCSEPAEGLTQQDFIRSVGTRCCTKITGKNAKKRQTSCFKKETSTLLRMSKNASPAYTRFISRSRTELREFS